MEIIVTELCDVEPYEDGITKGERVIHYEAKGETLLESFNDYVKNFDSDNIINSEDMFDGACLESEIIRVDAIIGNKLEDIVWNMEV